MVVGRSADFPFPPLQAGEKVVSDVVMSYKFIIGGLGGAMVLSFVYIMLLRWITGTIVWTSILAVLIFLGVGTYRVPQPQLQPRSRDADGFLLSVSQACT